jgi:glycyl-tRNA synthetase beta chain
VPIAGSFEKRFLEVPHEALVTTMKSNQKYFPVFDDEGALMNHFITIANIKSQDPAVIRAGNERVVRPRLSDAMFFWEQDGKRRLADHIESLREVVFQKDLGSMYDKSQRVTALAAWIARRIGADETLARRAGQLSRCDLMTEMVYEFPSMQGVMGRYQAARDGEDPEVAQALDEFYMPRFSGDRLPQTPSGIAVALAERVDTLVGIFGIGMKPTGDRDPFALRRAALGALRIIGEHSLTLKLRELLEEAREQLGAHLDQPDVVEEVEHFMLERLRGLYAERGVAGELFDAVAAVRPESLSEFDRRIEAVRHFSGLPEAEALAAANKRIANLLKKVEGEVPQVIDSELFEAAAESELWHKIDAIGHQIRPLLNAEDYTGVLKALAGLRDPVDRFFDDVMVMADDKAIRDNRLALLVGLQSLFLQVADISVLQSISG